MTDAEDALAKARNDLGASQSECIRLTRANDALNDEITREASAKGKLQEDKLKQEFTIICIYISFEPHGAVTTYI